MLVGYFLVIFLSDTVLVDVQADPIEILDKLLRPIVDFKENIINGRLTVLYRSIILAEISQLNILKAHSCEKILIDETFPLRCFWQRKMWLSMPYLLGSKMWSLLRSTVPLWSLSKPSKINKMKNVKLIWIL